MNEALTITPVTMTLEEVDVAKEAKIVAKVARVNRRLAKMGAHPGLLAAATFGPTVELRDDAWFDLTGFERFTTVFETVEVTGFEIAHAGWTPVASLDHTLTEDEALVSLFPSVIEAGETLPDEFRFRGSKCDHCKWNIARNTTVVFRNEAGEHIQIGSTCVLEFWGVDPRNILWLTEPFLGGDEFDKMPNPIFGVRPAEFLQAVTACWKVFGFEPTSSDGWPTRDAAAELLLGKPSKEKARRFADVDYFAPDAAAKTAEVTAWVEADDSGSDFMRSAKLALRSNYAADKIQGILACLPHVHDKHLGRESEKAIAAKRIAEQRALQTFVGTVGEKVIVEGTVTTAISIDTHYGTSKRITITTDDGAAVTTFGSGNTLWSVDVGDRVQWTGKVSEHTDDKWGKQTACKMVKLVVLAEAVAA